MPWTKKEKNILHHYLFGDKIIQNCFKKDAAYYYDNYLDKKLKNACPGSCYNNN